MTIHDVIIIGGGPAGCSAAVYAARKRLKTLLIAKEWGGQSTVSSDIQNWIGTPHISGEKLAENLKSHVLEYKSDVLAIKEFFGVSSISGSYPLFTVQTEDGEIFYSKTILIATGSSRRKLSIPGADTFEHKGLTYCASCDGPLFGGSPVAVIGGGNAAFESAAQLLAYCPTVYLLNRSEDFRADEITVQKLKQNPNLTILTCSLPSEIIGTQFVEGLTYTNAKTGEIHTLSVSGVFVEIGQIPATHFVENLVDLDQNKKIIIDPWTGKTSSEGVWAAGDCTNILYHQNNIAAGDAVKALEDIYVTIHSK
jgi:alkyl hydroperoxide reductase subunit F